MKPILLVEDEPNDVFFFRRAMNKAGLTNPVQVASDGEEALDFLFCRGAYQNRAIENAPKVVLLDLKLPKVDGIEVLRQVKQALDPHGLLNPGKAVPTLHRCAEFGRMHVRGGRLPHPELPRF